MGATPEVESVSNTNRVSMPFFAKLSMVFFAKISFPTRVSMSTSEPSREAATA